MKEKLGKLSGGFPYDMYGEIKKKGVKRGRGMLRGMFYHLALLLASPA